MTNDQKRLALERPRERWGSDVVRAATPADQIASSLPSAVFEPASAETLAEMLRCAHEERLSVVPRGAGTKLDWGSAPIDLDVILSTRCLKGPIDHRAGDLVATIPAGWPLEDANAVL